MIHRFPKMVNNSPSSLFLSNMALSWQEEVGWSHKTLEGSGYFFTKKKSPPKIASHPIFFLFLCLFSFPAATLLPLLQHHQYNTKFKLALSSDHSHHYLYLKKPWLLQNSRLNRVIIASFFGKRRFNSISCQ